MSKLEKDHIPFQIKVGKTNRDTTIAVINAASNPGDGFLVEITNAILELPGVEEKFNELIGVITEKVGALYCETHGVDRKDCEIELVTATPSGKPS